MTTVTTKALKQLILLSDAVLKEKGLCSCASCAGMVKQ